MPFELPAMPNFNPQIPAQPDVMQKYGQMLALKNMVGQQKMLPGELQEQQNTVTQGQLQNQQTQMKIASQQAMIKAWSDPDFTKEITGGEEQQPTGTTPGIGFDPNAMTASLVKRGVLPEDAMQLTGQFVDRANKMSETAKNLGAAGADQVKIYATAHEQLAGLLEPITKMPIEKAGPALDAVKAKLLKSPIPGLDRTDAALVNSATLDHLPAMINVLGIQGQIAEIAGKNAQAKAAEQQVIPDSGGLSPASEQKVQQDVATATNPQIQAGKVAVAKEEGIARAQTEMQVQAEIARGSNAALAKVPPHLVSEATQGAIKAGTEFAQAQSVTQAITAMMAAAKNGNVVSYQLIPQEGALEITTSQGVHRINMAEIQNYGGGSLWQRMQGHIGKTLTGKSIPDSVLDDMSEMQKIIAEGSRSKYENTLSTINSATGSTFKPVEMPVKTVAAAGVLPSVTFKGKTYTPDQLKGMGYKFNEAQHQWEK